MAYLGIDIGSISVKLALVDRDGSIVWECYKRIKERPLETFLKAFSELPDTGIEGAAVTGVGGRVLSELLGIPFVNEIVAHTKAVEHLHPEVRTIIDMGGEDSKLILVEKSSDGRLEIVDFSLNSLCAAGTGSFLDQQATRLGYTIEEFGRVALKSKNPPRIAGRCSVFAKSDMIHLQQIGTPDYDIIAGLCFSLARNFKSTIGRGREFRRPVAFQGGVAANLGMRRAFKEVLGLSDDEFIVPEHFATMGAIGAILSALESGEVRSFKGIEPVKEYIERTAGERDAYEPLSLEKTRIIEAVVGIPENVKGRIPAYLGIDVGSISTNLVVIDEEGNVLAKRYLMTAGRPLEAIKKGLKEIGEEIGDRVEIVGVGTTGSGRYLAGDFVGADVIRNEITAQARAAVHIDPEVDTIFEIGGQDSKYISIEGGAVVDFEMNKACAAGTGSFLEEQAERLGVNIKGEFQELALKSKAPVRMGERCTVFIETDLVHHLQQGAPVEDICAGLAYSIVYNYLNRVVGDRKIGKNIFFQGGTAFNRAVVAAFEKVLGRGITVPPHHEVTGAIGAALLARDEKPKEQKTNFKGFDLYNRKYTLETFECNGCANVCMISKVTIEGEKPLFYGGRCEKYEVDRRKKDLGIPDYFSMREEMLMEYYQRAREKTEDAKEEIGIPYCMYMREFLPLWATFFAELGIRPVLSGETNKVIIKKGVEAVVSELCFPVKIAHGHVLALVEKGIKRVFIPSFIDQPPLVEGVKRSFNCPFSQTLPYTIKAAIDFEKLGVLPITPVIRMGRTKEIEEKDFVNLGRMLGKSPSQSKKAWKKAKEAQEEFFRRQRELGKKVLSELPGDSPTMVVIGRPYNIYDLSANLDIPRKMRNLGVHVIPMDFLPIEEEREIDDELKEMYWKYGQKILKTANIIRKDPRLYAVYITNFGCGPDSFITHFFKRTLGGKPFLQLEIDEHSADAGLITRCEAYLDSLKNNKVKVGKREPFRRPPIKGRMKRIFIPYMCDHSFALAAAFKACGVDAEVFPESDEETLRLGRRYCSGKECYPCILTTGDMVKIATSKGFDPETTAFFMPSGNGPCRFGQYNRFHRMVLDEIGFPQTPIFAPNQDDTFYDTLEIIGSKFSRLGWWGIVSVDILTKLLHENRPYEREKGSVEKAYWKHLRRVCEAIEREKGLDALCRILVEAAEEITSLRDPKAPQRPIVGVVGEIYVRSNRFANEDVIRKIEYYGGEAWLAPISEWIHYTNAMARRKAREERNWKALLGLKLKEYYQDKDQEKLERAVEGYVKNLPEPPVERLLELASPYIDPSFEGEAILTIGKSIDFYEKGASGIVSCMPFSCMPGTLTTAVFKRLREDYDNIPVLDLAFDGQKELNTLIRLEAFMFQVKSFFKKKGYIMEAAN